jgi:predicted helicase
MNTYSDYLKKQIAEKLSEISDEQLLYTIYAILMEHVIQETQQAHP